MQCRRASWGGNANFYPDRTHPPGSIDLHIGMLAFRLMLSNPVGGVILGTRAECRVLIVPGSKMKHKV